MASVFQGIWTQRNGTVVPEPDDLALSNDGVNLDAVVLYADMNGSTKMVDNNPAPFSAEVYKSYLMCAGRLIKAEGGSITAYDGDRIMAVFIGNTKNTSAARAALKINMAVDEIINPQLKAVYASSDFVLRHTIGIDASTLLAARIGVRNDNDIVWVGKAANHAAKLSNYDDKDQIIITKTVYDSLHDSLKFNGSPRAAVWTERIWAEMDNATCYSSSWRWFL